MEKITFEEAQEILIYEDSFTRMEAVVKLHPKMERTEWLKVLGEEWTCSDNIWAQHKTLKALLGTKGPILEMMEKEEITIFNELSEELTVYRGCGPHNKKGASWSLDRSVAEKFPFRLRYKVQLPGLITGIVKKKNVLAVKLDREEQEIISFSVKPTGIEFIMTNPFTNEPVNGYAHLLKKGHELS